MIDSWSWWQKQTLVCYNYDTLGNEAFWLDVVSPVTSFNQLDCFLLNNVRSYVVQKFVYDMAPGAAVQTNSLIHN